MWCQSSVCPQWELAWLDLLWRPPRSRSLSETCSVGTRRSRFLGFGASLRFAPLVFCFLPLGFFPPSCAVPADSNQSSLECHGALSDSFKCCADLLHLFGHHCSSCGSPCGSLRPHQDVRWGVVSRDFFSVPHLSLLDPSFQSSFFLGQVDQSDQSDQSFACSFGVSSGSVAFLLAWYWANQVNRRLLSRDPFVFCWVSGSGSCVVRGVYCAA